MERRKVFDYPRASPNRLDRYVHGAHGAMAERFCVALAILLSCRILSAQPLEDPQAQYNRGTDYWYGSGPPKREYERRKRGWKPLARPRHRLNYRRHES